MNPISLISNHNPKNQLNLPSFHAVQASPMLITNTLQTKEIKVQEGYENKDARFYEEEINKLAYMNTIIAAQLASALEQRKIVMRLISQAERQQQSAQIIQKQKRTRRCAKDIQRKLKCPQKDCQKSYGSEGSLVQHIRLKHPKINSHDPPLLLFEPRLNNT